MTNNYEVEARERYGGIAAYREHTAKTKHYTKEKWAEANDGMMAIFAEFAACKENGVRADSTEGTGACSQASGTHYGELLHLHR